MCLITVGESDEDQVKQTEVERENIVEEKRKRLEKKRFLRREVAN